MSREKTLVLHLPMNERVGDVAYDHSGKGNHGTIYGASRVDGKFSKALRLDGVNDYVDLGAQSDLIPKAGILTEPSIVDDGVWCWFADPRAIYYNGNTYFGFVNRLGEIIIAKYNHAGGTVSTFTLHEFSLSDDHANPAILIRPDGKILAVYSQHSGNVMYWRVSTNVEDISAWEEEQHFGFTLNNPHIIRSSNDFFLIVRGGEDNKLWMRLTIDGTQYNLFSDNPVPTDEFVHVVGTYDGEKMKLYVNGVQDGELEVIGEITSAGHALLIGTFSEVGEDGNNWKGILDELRIYNRALSDGEIEDNYNLEEPPTDGLVMYLKCDELVGDDMEDSSGEENHGVSYGAEIVDGKVNKAREFDGWKDYVKVPADETFDVAEITMEAWVKNTMLPPEGTSEAPYTYPHLLRLNNGDTWVLFAGTNGVYYRISDDDGDTWGDAVRLTLFRYFKVETDGTKIYFAGTPGHPMNPEVTPLCYMYYDSGEEAWYKADGTLIGDVDDMPFLDTQLDVLNTARCWIWDIAIDDGKPVIVYVEFPVVEEPDHYSVHNYKYIRWNGSAWLDHDVASDGFLDCGADYLGGVTQEYYSGGIVLDHDDTSVVYLCKKVDGAFETFKYATADGGINWTPTQLTSGCADKCFNMRPVVVRNHDSALQVLWMYGYYAHYMHYNIMLRTYPEITITKTRELAISPFTFSLIVNPLTDAVFTGTRIMLRKQNAYWMGMARSSRLLKTLLTFDSKAYTYLGGSSIPLNALSLVTLTYDGLKLTSYFNGVMDYWIAVTGYIDNQDVGILTLGKNLIWTNDFWHGDLDEFRVFNRALTANEILSLYTYNKPTNPFKEL